MAFNQMGQSRDVGLNHGAGKGSAPRNNSSKAFRDNFDGIDWDHDIPFEFDHRVRRKSGKLIKRYK